MLDMVLGRLEEAGLRPKRKKCTFLADEVVYLGHRIDQRGLHPVQDKVDAILKARSPENVHERQAFLGLLNYYVRSLYNLLSVDRISAIGQITVQGTHVVEGTATTADYQRAKDLVLSTEVLGHFDLNKPILLQRELWTWRSALAHHRRWYRASRWICINDTQSCRKKLFVARQGGSPNNVCIEEIPQTNLWTLLCDHD